MDNNFTENAKIAIGLSKEEAIKAKNSYIDEEHLLIGILKKPDPQLFEVFRILGINIQQLITDIGALLKEDTKPVQDPMPLTALSEKMIRASVLEARKMKHPFISTYHMFLSIIKNGIKVKPIFDKYDITYNTFETYYLKSDELIDKKSEADKIWKACTEEFKVILTNEEYNKWFAPIKAVHLKNDTLTIQVPDQTTYEYVEMHYNNLIAKALRSVSKIPLQLEYRILVDGSHMTKPQPGLTKPGSIPLERRNKFSIHEKIEPVLSIEEESQEIADLLTSLQLETGMMVGLFGRWGRGKTLFWNKVWGKLSGSGNKPFYKVEFHAWKYQDTPATWAYLYERLSHEYLNSYHRLGNPYKWWKTFHLNFKRRGFVPILKFLFILLLGVATWYTLETLSDNKLTEFHGVITYIGFPLTGIVTLYHLLSYLKKEYSSQAKDLFLKYSQKHTFKEHLGIQAEIQKEILTLVKVWIPSKMIGKKRILLFVDDLDRCNETKIIQIIDSLRVMLDDIEISKRIVVLIAVDERILKLAIAHKYHDLVSKDINPPNPKSKQINPDNLIREYMDKLFIAGIKLKSLSFEEKKSVLRAISKDKIHFINVKSQGTKMNDNDLENKPGKYLAEEGSDIDIAFQEKEDLSKYELEEFEFQMLEKILDTDAQLTPRNIRIFYYRYLLAKRFMTYTVVADVNLFTEWNMNTDKSILPNLILYYSHIAEPERLYLDYKDAINQTVGMVEVTVFAKKFNVSKFVFIELLKIVDTVVPY